MSSNRHALAVFRSVQLAEPLAILLGGRLTWYRNNDWSEFYPSPRSITVRRSNAVFTPYAGIVYDVSRDISLYASYTDIFRPNTVRNRDGNILPPQRGNNIEIGLKGEHFDGRLTTAIALFRSREDNLAVREPGVVLPDGSAVYRAASGAKGKGVEVTVAGEPLPSLQLSGGYTWHAKRDENDVLLDPNLPRHLLRLAGSYRLPGELSRLTIGGNVGYQSSIYYDEAYGLGRIPQGSVTLVGLFARYEVNDQLTVSANVENVTDKHYFSGLGYYNGYIYGNPRNAWVRASYRF